MIDIDIPESMLEMMEYTKEEFDGLTTKQKEILAIGERLFGYKMIAEVVKSCHCGYKPIVGDRYVFAGGGTLIPEECTWPICLMAVTPMLPYIYMYYDRIRAGLDPNDMWMETIKCADVGTDCGGFGEVLFKIIFQKVDEEEKMKMLQDVSR